jgi:hypothetical protein
MRRWMYFQFRSKLHRWFQVRHQMWNRLATKSLGCESSEKYGSIRLKGVQLQDERAPLEVRVLHHEDATLGPDLEMTPKAVLHLLVRLGARKM